MDINKKNILDKQKYLFIIAHHDDETLLFGGIINYLKKKYNAYISILVLTTVEKENINYVGNIKYKNFISVINQYDIDDYDCLNMDNNILLKYDCKLKNLRDNEIFLLDKKNIINQKLILYDKEYGSLSNSQGIKTIKTEEDKIRLEYNRIVQIKQMLISQVEQVRDKYNSYIIDTILIDNNEELINIKNLLINYVKNKNYNVIFTHNKFGEYGNIQHKLLYLIVKNLKNNEWKDYEIYTTCNSQSESDIEVKIDKNSKTSMIKLYNFKDTENNKDIWYKQCLKNYTFWSDNDSEYYQKI